MKVFTNALLAFVLMLMIGCSDGLVNNDEPANVGDVQTLNKSDDDKRDDDRRKDDRKKDDRKKDGDRVACFEFVYPITYIMPDRSTITGRDKESVMAAFKRWYAAHPDTKVKPMLKYPVNIMMGDRIITVTNQEMMDAVYARCRALKDDKKDDRLKDRRKRNHDRKDDRKDNDRENAPCFKYVYPITYVMPDRTTITITSAEEMMKLRKWYSTHRDTRARPVLQYPVAIVIGDMIIRVASQEEMDAILKRCRGEDDKRDDRGGRG
jgi:hypothetical protein